MVAHDEDSRDGIGDGVCARMSSELTSMNVTDEFHVYLKMPWSFVGIGSGEMKGERIDHLARRAKVSFMISRKASADGGHLAAFHRTLSTTGFD